MYEYYYLRDRVSGDIYVVGFARDGDAVAMATPALSVREQHHKAVHHVSKAEPVAPDDAYFNNPAYHRERFSIVMPYSLNNRGW